MEAAAAAAAAAQQLACSGLTALSQRLTKHLCATNTVGAACNLVFSPLSIYSALSAMAAGARGRTLSELLDVLGATSREGLAEDALGTAQHALAGCSQLGGPLVALACGLWHDATRTPTTAYRNTAVPWGGVPCAVDFLNTTPEEAGKQINSWVAARTDNLIDSILHPGSVNKDTRLMLTDAVYFKGSLERLFVRCSSNTEYGSFHRLDGSAVDAQFMCSNEDQFIATHDGFKVLKMMYAVRDPYHGLPARTMAALLWANNFSLRKFPRHSMYIVLPDARDGLWSLEDKMASSPAFLYGHLPERRVQVGELRVPRFKMSFSTSVKHALQDLGIEALFSTGADLQDMMEHDGPRSREPLFLADVLHKTVIEVNEEGMMPTATRPKRRLQECVDFVADHPFAFYVVEEESGAILFMGHVLDPTQS